MTEPESEWEGTIKFLAKEVDTGGQLVEPSMQSLQPQTTMNTPGQLGFITHLSEGEHSPENLKVSQQEGVRKNTCDKIWACVK